MFPRKLGLLRPHPNLDEREALVELHHGEYGDLSCFTLTGTALIRLVCSSVREYRVDRAVQKTFAMRSAPR